MGTSSDGSRRTSARHRGVLIGGCLLAILASAANTHFLLTAGVSVSHLTGDLARVAGDIVRPDRVATRELLWLSVAVVGFLVGASVSGFFIHHPRFTIARPYGRTIASIGLLFIVAALMAPHIPAISAFTAACACGIQNGLATRYRGLILRTTHVTGLITDIGQMLGMRCAGHRIEGWKISVQASICLAFFTGALAGAWLHLRYHSGMLGIIGGLYLGGGLLWSCIKHWALRSGRPSAS